MLNKIRTVIGTTAVMTVILSVYVIAVYDLIKR